MAMRQVFYIGLLLGIKLGATSSAYSQMILVGSTGGVAGIGPQPNTRLVDIDLLTGATSNPRDLGITGLCGIATQPATGLLFGLTSFATNPSNSLIRINPATGAVTNIGPTGLTTIVEGDLAFNPVNGFLYGIQQVDSLVTQRNLFRIDPSTGAAVMIGDVGSLGNTTDFSGLAFNAAGTLFALDTDAGGGLARLMTIDLTNAQIVSMVTTNVNFGSAAGLTFDPISGVAYVGDNISGTDGTNSLYSLNVLTGNLTLIGPTGDPQGIAGLAFIGVPEPSSFLLVGFGGLLAWRRFRGGQNKKQAGRDAPACS